MTLQDARMYDVDDGDAIIKFSDFFEPKAILGKGTFGTVVGAVMKSDRKEYAVKIIKKTLLFGILISDFMHEAEILAQLNHPNVVRFVKILESDSKFLLVMEWVRGGRLTDFISERTKLKNPFTDEEAATIMKSVLSGVEYIHSKNILHRDLKPENILIEDKNDLSTIKICDFGLSAQYDNSLQFRSFEDVCGTRIFMAPELWSSKKYSRPVDMWSCGIILYLLISGGKHPLWTKGDTSDSYLAKLANPEWIFPEAFNKYSKHLFLKLVQNDPQFRYTAEVAKGHPWITRKFEEQAPLMGSEKIKAYSKSLVTLRIIKILYLFQVCNGNSNSLSESYKSLTQEIDEELSKTGKNRYSVNVKDAIRDVIATLLSDPEKRVSLDNDMFTTPPRDFFFRNGATRDRANTDWTYAMKSSQKSPSKRLEKTPPKLRYNIFKNLLLSPLSSSVDGNDLKKESGSNSFDPDKNDTDDKIDILTPKKISDDNINLSNYIKIMDQPNPSELQTISTINTEDQSLVKYHDVFTTKTINTENSIHKIEKFSNSNTDIPLNIPNPNNSGSEASMKSRTKNFLIGSLMKYNETKNKTLYGYHIRTGISKNFDEKNIIPQKSNSIEKEKSTSIERRNPRKSNILNSSLDTINLTNDFNKKVNKKVLTLDKKKKTMEIKKLPNIFERLFTETTERNKLNSTNIQEPIVGVRTSLNRTSQFQKLAERSSTNVNEKKSILFSSEFYNLPKIKLISKQEK